MEGPEWTKRDLVGKRKCESWRRHRFKVIQMADYATRGKNILTTDLIWSLTREITVVVRGRIPEASNTKHASNYDIVYM